MPGRKRVASESSEMSESSNSAPPVRLEEVAGVEPEVQKTPRKVDGVKGEDFSYFIVHKNSKYQAIFAYSILGTHPIGYDEPFMYL